MKNNTKISISFLTISMLLLLYTYYQSEFVYDGLRKSYYFIYYLSSFVLIILSIITFFLNEKTFFKILTILISTVFTLYVIEGFLLIRANKTDIEKSVQRIAKKKNIKFDTRSTFEIYNDLKKKDANVVLRIPPSIITYKNKKKIFSQSGISKRQTIGCNDHGYYSIYQADRYGFNNPDSAWDKQQIEYLLIGDSFAHGSCVNEIDSIAGKIREITNKQNVLNLGYDGKDPLLEYATLREYLPYINSKRVLWIYYEGDDLRELNQRIKNKILKNYLDNLEYSQKLILNQDQIDSAHLKSLEKKYMYQKIQRNEFFKFIKLLNLRIFITNLFLSESIYTQETIKLFKKIIILSKNLVEQNNAKFYFIYMPAYERYDNKIKIINNYKNYVDIIRIIKNLNLPIIDIHKELLVNYKDPLSLYPFRSHGHFTELGYDLVSQTIVEKIYQLENN